MLHQSQLVYATIAEEKIFFDGKQSEIDLPFKISF